MTMKKLSRTFFLSTIALATTILIVSCGSPAVLTSQTSKPAEVSHSDKPKPVRLVSEEAPFRFSMYPIYDNETESLVYFQIENLDEKKLVVDAEVVGFFVGLDGDSQKKTFKLAPDKKRYVAPLPLKHHDTYDVQVFVQFPDKQKFSPVFSFHCADPLPEIDWLNSEEGQEK